MDWVASIHSARRVGPWVEQRFSAALRPFWNWALQFAEKTRFWVEQRFSAGERTCSRASEENELSEPPAPDGRSSLARCFSAGERTRSRTIEANKLSENPAPEGRSSLAQRFSAGDAGRNDSSPGGTTEFSPKHCACGRTPEPRKAPTPNRYSGGHDF